MNNTLTALHAFVNDFNNDKLKYPAHISQDRLDSMAMAYSTCLAKSLTPEKEEPFKLRLSQIGKPTIIQALKLIGYSELPLLNGRLRDTVFHLGREFEARFKYLIELYGKAYDLEVTGEEVDTEFMGVSGHADIILNDELLLELKTMGSGSFREASRTGVSDDLGYFTQLAAYQASTGLQGAWVVEDKASSTIKLIDGPTPTQQQDRLDRAVAIIDGLRDLEEFYKKTGDVEASTYHALELFEIPEPREWRNKLYLPWSMAWTPFRDALYVYEQEDSKSPVFIDYMEDEEVVEILGELLDEGLITHEDKPDS